MLLRRVSLSLVLLALAIVADRGCGDAAVLKPPRVVSLADLYMIRMKGTRGHVGCFLDFFTALCLTANSLSLPYRDDPLLHFCFWVSSPLPNSVRMSQRIEVGQGPRGRIDIDRPINIDSRKLSKVSKTRNATFGLSVHLSIAIGSEALIHCTDGNLNLT